MNSLADRIRHLDCGCRHDAATGIATHLCPDHDQFEIDITTANNLISEWANIAASIARQCKWRPQGQCLVTCQGIAVCNLDGLEFVDAQGRPAGGPQPLKET